MAVEAEQTNAHIHLLLMFLTLTKTGFVNKSMLHSTVLILYFLEISRKKDRHCYIITAVPYYFLQFFPVCLSRPIMGKTTHKNSCSKPLIINLYKWIACH